MKKINWYKWASFIIEIGAFVYLLYKGIPSLTGALIIFIVGSVNYLDGLYGGKNDNSK